MPGLIGRLGAAAGPAVPEHAVGVLLHHPFYVVTHIPMLRNGNAALIDPAALPYASGYFHDPQSQKLIAFWGEFYEEEFENCITGASVAHCLLEKLGDRPLENLARLDGSFVIFYQDRDRQLLVSDRTASRPLYYLETGAGIVFAPELKAFGRLLPQKPKLNRNAMISFLASGHPLNDETYFQGVRLLRPSSYLEITAERVRIGSYADYRPADPHARAATADYRDGLAGVLRASLRRRRRHIEQAVFPISGGYDSRGILGCVREFYSGRLRTVSWGIEEDRPGTDAAIGRKVAEYFGTEHRFLRRDQGYLLAGLEEGTHQLDASNFDPLIHPHEPVLIQQLRCDGHPVLFRGDECFGYRGPAASAVEAMARVGLRDLSQFPALFPLFRQGVLGPALDQQRASLAAVIQSCPQVEDWSIAKDWLYLNQRLFRSLNFSHYAKLSVVEARNPWLDRDVLGFFKSLPVSCRYDKALYRNTLHHMFPDLMSRIPIASQGSAEDWKEVARNDAAFLAFARSRLVHHESALTEVWDRQAISSWIDKFERRETAEPLRVKILEGVKPFVRKHLKTLYRIAKSGAPSSMIVKPIPPQEIIGRLLMLELWTSRWA